MTNEELAVAIQNGQTELLPMLWEQIRHFVRCHAVAWVRAFPNRSDFDADDLEQAGYLAIYDALRYFDADKGYKFLTLYELLMRREFRRVAGIRTSKRDAALLAEYSLDSPVNAAEADGATMGDLLPDPRSEAPFDAVLNRAEQAHIRATLDRVAADRLTEQQRRVYDGLIHDLRCIDMANDRGISAQAFQYRKKDVFNVLREDPRILQLWLDLTKNGEAVGDVVYRYAANPGAQTFHESGASCVEKAVERILQNEQRQQGKRQQLTDAVSERLHEAARVDAQKRRQMQRRKMAEDLAVFERARA